MCIRDRARRDRPKRPSGHTRIWLRRAPWNGDDGLSGGGERDYTKSMYKLRELREAVSIRRAGRNRVEYQYAALRYYRRGKVQPVHEKGFSKNREGSGLRHLYGGVSCWKQPQITICFEKSVNKLLRNYLQYKKKDV